MTRDKLQTIFTDIDIQNTVEFKKTKLALILKELQRRKDLYNSIYCKDLLPHQKEFIYSKQKFTVLLGGNRSGKTFAGLFNVILFCLDLHPVYRLKRSLDGEITVWVVGLDRVNHLAPTLFPRFQSLLPETEIDAIDTRNLEIKLKNGVHVYFKSCDSGASKFQSAAVDFLWFDEEPPEAIWREAITRTIDKSAPVYVTMTPTNGVSWSYSELYQKAENGGIKDGEIVKDVKVLFGDRIKVIRARMTDNTFLSKDEVENFLKNLDETEKAVRLNGDYISFGDKKVFDAFTLGKLSKTLHEPIWRGEPYGGKVVESQNGGLRVYEEPNEVYAGNYVLSADLSEGVGDESALVVLRFMPFQQEAYVVATYHKKLNPEEIHNAILSLARVYYNPLLIIENNSIGGAVLERLKFVYEGQIYVEERVGKTFSTKGELTTRLGWHTDVASKVKLIRDFKEIVQKFKFILNDVDIYKQMDFFIEDKKGRMRASTGHDDLIMATMIACQALYSNQFQYNIMVHEKEKQAGRLTGLSRREVEQWVNY